MMRESKIERTLVKRVRAAGGEIRKLAWIGRRGAPDRLVMLPGRRPFLVELKAPKGRLSKIQEREHMILLPWFDVWVCWSMESLEEIFQ
jgi:tRNA U54 and U55 pseudouridine synthase Pus10